MKREVWFQELWVWCCCEYQVHTSVREESCWKRVAALQKGHWLGLENPIKDRTYKAVDDYSYGAALKLWWISHLVDARISAKLLANAKFRYYSLMCFFIVPSLKAVMIAAMKKLFPWSYLISIISPQSHSEEGGLPKLWKTDLNSWTSSLCERLGRDEISDFWLKLAKINTQ